MSVDRQPAGAPSATTFSADTTLSSGWRGSAIGNARSNLERYVGDALRYLAASRFLQADAGFAQPWPGPGSSGQFAAARYRTFKTYPLRSR